MITALITCVNYDDYLAQTLPYTKKAVDNVIVITVPSDTATIEVCKAHDVPAIPTDTFHSDGAVFRKGAGINVGITKAQPKDWLIHLDADIVLPKPLSTTRLDKRKIYTVPRVNIIGMAEWQKLQEDWTAFDARELTGIHRLTSGGIIPCGYFQLWHFPTCPVKYHTASPNAEMSDLRFALSWPVNRRTFYPRYKVFHLVGSSDLKRANWNGRKTPTFA